MTGIDTAYDDYYSLWGAVPVTTSALSQERLDELTALVAAAVFRGYALTVEEIEDFDGEALADVELGRML